MAELLPPKTLMITFADVPGAMPSLVFDYKRCTPIKASTAAFVDTYSGGGHYSEVL